ncbi:MAG: hypothetical protein IPO97_00760 [Sphingomonadales bacterium]|nr:hypothetical protein [Sphingomonadales bacterium]
MSLLQFAHKHLRDWFSRPFLPERPSIGLMTGRSPSSEIENARQFSYFFQPDFSPFCRVIFCELRHSSNIRSVFRLGAVLDLLDQLIGCGIGGAFKGFRLVCDCRLIRPRHLPPTPGKQQGRGKYRAHGPPAA